MAAQFTLVSKDQRIEVRTTRKHANLLESTVSASIGAFSGSFKAEFATTELINLHERLVSSVAAPSGPISFGSANGDLSLVIEFVGTEQAIIRGTMRPHLLQQAKLDFRFDATTASLGPTIQDLEDVIREFGV